MGRAARAVTIGLLTGLLAGLAGCGTSLTGGSIPPGGNPSRAEGFVLRGDTATQVLPGATLTFEPTADRAASRTGFVIITPPDTGNGGNGGDGGNGGNGGNGGPVVVPSQPVPGTVQSVSDASGRFVASTLTPGSNRLTVTPPAGSGLATIQYTLSVEDGVDYWMVLAPPPAGTSFAGLSGIDVSPGSIDVEVGGSVQLMVGLRGGNPPAMVPSYLLRGAVGVVNAQGRFAGVRPGSGVLRVVVGPYEVVLPVTVRPIN